MNVKIGFTGENRKYDSRDRNRRRHYVEDHETVQLDSFEIWHPSIRPLYNLAEEWIERKNNGSSNLSLVICGDVGIGKTHISRILFWSVIERDKDVYSTIPFCEDDPEYDPLQPEPEDTVIYSEWYTRASYLKAYQLIQLIESDFDISSLISKTCPVVIIDDVGNEVSIKYVSMVEQAAERQRRYNVIIDHCYENEISVVMTSNFDLVELCAHLGKRSWDRLSEMAPKGYMIEIFDVSSYREVRSGRVQKPIEK